MGAIGKRGPGGLACRGAPQTRKCKKKKGVERGRPQEEVQEEAEVGAPATAAERTEAPRPARLSVVVVTFNSAAELGRSLPPLLEQLDDADELVVVDNASQDGSADEAARIAPGARLIRNRENLGFAAGVNAGAAAARGDLLLLLNPDAVARPGFAEAIRAPLAEGREWAAWMGLVTSEGGRLLNTDGNVVHFTGITWAGGAGQEAPAAVARREVSALSGACLAVPRATWERLGGFPAEFFSYQEDTDLSLRLRLEGEPLGLEPAAVVDHAYEFAKGPVKWRHLERNRWAILIRTYPASLLALIAPVLVLTELALLGVSIAGGWGRQKLLATRDTLRALPRLLAERRSIQARRRVSAGRFAAALTAELDSPFLGRLAQVRPLRWGLRAYWSLVRRLLGSGRAG
jgi:GT2 family glycosyltransferase